MCSTSRPRQRHGRLEESWCASCANRRPAGRWRCVAKYVQLNDAYLSVVRGPASRLHRIGCLPRPALDLRRKQLGKSKGQEALLHGHGPVVGGRRLRAPGRGRQDPRRSAGRCESRFRFLGFCLGMQCAVSPGPHERLVSVRQQRRARMADSLIRYPPAGLTADVVDLAAPCALRRLPLSPVPRAAWPPASMAREVGLTERHAIAYEFNKRYRQLFLDSGYRIQAAARPDAAGSKLIETHGHRFFNSLPVPSEFLFPGPGRPHPLFRCLASEKPPSAPRPANGFSECRFLLRARPARATPAKSPVSERTNQPLSEIAGLQLRGRLPWPP